MNDEEHITKIIKLDLDNSMLTSFLCDYSDAYILAKGPITAANTTRIISQLIKDISGVLQK